MIDYLCGILTGIIIGSILFMAIYDPIPAPEYHKYISRQSIVHIVQDQSCQQYYYFIDSGKEVKIKKQ